MFHVLGWCGLLLQRLLLLAPIGLLVVCLKGALFWVGVAVRLGGPLKRTVRLGGLVERPVRRNAADARGGGEVHLYRDSFAALLLDLRRRLKAIMNVLDVTIRDGVSSARSVELVIQSDGVLRVGPLGPVTWDDYLAASRCGPGESRRHVGDLHCRLSDLIHEVVFHRRMWQLLLGGVGYRRILLFILLSGSGQIWCPHLTPGGSGVLADPARIGDEF